MSEIKVTINLEELIKDMRKLGEKIVCDTTTEELEKYWSLRKQHDKIKNFLGTYNSFYIEVEGSACFYD